MGTLVQLCFDLIVAGVVLYIIWVVLGMIPMLAPFKTIVMLVFTLICIVVLFNLLSPLLMGGLSGNLAHVGGPRERFNLILVPVRLLFGT